MLTEGTLMNNDFVNQFSMTSSLIIHVLIVLLIFSMIYCNIRHFNSQPKTPINYFYSFIPKYRNILLKKIFDKRSDELDKLAASCASLICSVR